jgi:hypothetical protein
MGAHSDDPDLHIHISMIAQLMESLEQIVRQRRGQLIVASHSETVWDHFQGSGAGRAGPMARGPIISQPPKRPCGTTVNQL